MTKVIAFSLWGNAANYTIGAIRNAELRYKLYPDWVCRFYIDDTTVASQIVNILGDLDCEIVPMSHGDFRATLWRFYPASDLDVDIMLSRDTDSRLTEREKVAVDEWLLSGKSFHIIRDHPDHMYRILAGMWGCRCNVLRDMKVLLANWNQENKRQVDQEFLAAVIYPRIINDCFIHDDFHIYPKEVVHKVKHKRVDYEHIGGYINEDEKKSSRHCQILKEWFDKHAEV